MNSLAQVRLFVHPLQLLAFDETYTFFCPLFQTGAVVLMSHTFEFRSFQKLGCLSGIAGAFHIRVEVNGHCILPKVHRCASREFTQLAIAVSTHRRGGLPVLSCLSFCFISPHLLGPMYDIRRQMVFLCALRPTHFLCARLPVQVGFKRPSFSGGSGLFFAFPVFAGNVGLVVGIRFVSLLCFLPSFPFRFFGRPSNLARHRRFARRVFCYPGVALCHPGHGFSFFFGDCPLDVTMGLG